MTVILSDNNLFGGYAPMTWASRNGTAYDANSFIFTLTNPSGIPPTRYFNTRNQHSIVDDAS